MEIREKYNIEETPHSFSLQPYKHQLKLSWYFLFVVIVSGIIALRYHSKISEGVLICLYFAMIYLTGHSLYDIMIRAEIRFVFDGISGNIFKERKNSRRKIMRLNEAVIFISSVNGSWYYSLGAKGSHLVKSYMISESFNSGTKSRRKQEQYESGVLKKINVLIEKSKQQESTIPLTFQNT